MAKTGSESSLLVNTTESVSTTDNERVKTLYRMQDASRIVLRSHRINICHRTVLATTDRVPVYKHNKTGKARFGGLMTCGRGWVCPICAHRLARRRRLLLAYIVGKLTALGYRHSLVTYTLAHNIQDDLSTVKNALQDAYRRTKQGRAYVAITNTYGVIGSIRTIEITHGANGWHPHIHELLIHSHEALPDVLDAAIRPRYIAALAKSGRTGNEHALDVKASDDEVYEYITKYGHMPLKEWSIAHEMTAQASKSGRAENRSTMQILYDYSRKPTHSDKWLWRELAAATHGTATMFISPAIRKLVNVPALNDEIEARDAEKEPDENVFADLHLMLWDVIRDKLKRWQILTMANESETFEQFKSKVESDIAVNIMRLDNSSLTVLDLGGGVGRGGGEGMLNNGH